MNGPDRLSYRSMLLAELLSTPAAASFAGDPNRCLLASIIAGQATASSCLPHHLGLGEATHENLLADYFPFFESAAKDQQCESIPEWIDLQKLLLDHRAGERDSELWIADIVATACAGRDHLWQDLGLANRDELTRLMWVNFPELARANTGDMKWKKFLYRQFCSREGIYVCPAPSCGECKDYAKCFGPET
jgi:nitrogen fixation protein NifQ